MISAENLSNVVDPQLLKLIKILEEKGVETKENDDGSITIDSDITIKHTLIQRRDYFKSKQAIIYKEHAELTYINDGGVTAERMHCKLKFTNFKITDDMLILYNCPDGD